MLNVYARGPDGHVRKADAPEAAIDDGSAVWIDLFEPTEAEELLVEQAYGLDAPTNAERMALEDSARFYEDDGALVLTATLLTSRPDGNYGADAVSFVLAKDRLITVRQIDTRAFQIGAGRASVRMKSAANGEGVLLALLESVTERVADILQDCSQKSVALSQSVFVTEGEGPNMSHVLSVLGRLGGVVTLARESAASLERAAAFAQHMCDKHALPGPQLAALARDADNLERTADALQNHLNFQLDAALGLVAAAQNNSLQRLSVAAMVFVPSTLIAGIFGMNFKAMTIFNSPWGPWICFGLMIASALAALAYARRRHWI